MKLLTTISEPFKIYSRNAGGTEYKTYSPFTLFADACTADASAVREFENIVNQYIKHPEPFIKETLLKQLDSWMKIENQLNTIAPNAPLISRVIPYAERVAKISSMLSEALRNDTISQENFETLKTLLAEKEDPSINLDVELAVSNDVLKLVDFLANK